MLFVECFLNLLILFGLSNCFDDAFTLAKLKKTKSEIIAKPPKIIVFKVLPASHLSKQP